MLSQRGPHKMKSATNTKCHDVLAATPLLPLFKIIWKRWFSMRHRVTVSFSDMEKMICSTRFVLVPHLFISQTDIQTLRELAAFYFIFNNKNKNFISYPQVSVEGFTKTEHESIFSVTQQLTYPWGSCQFDIKAGPPINHWSRCSLETRLALRSLFLRAKGQFYVLRTEMLWISFPLWTKRLFMF